MKKFVKSESWKRIHEIESGHIIAYSYFKQTFKENKILFYDGKSCQKVFVEKIDKNKKEGIFKCKNIFVMHIGSTAGILDGWSSFMVNIDKGWNNTLGDIVNDWSEFIVDVEQTWEDAKRKKIAFQTITQ